MDPASSKKSLIVKVALMVIKAKVLLPTPDVQTVVDLMDPSSPPQAISSYQQDWENHLGSMPLTIAPIQDLPGSDWNLLLLWIWWTAVFHGFAPHGRKSHFYCSLPFSLISSPYNRWWNQGWSMILCERRAAQPLADPVLAVLAEKLQSC